MCYDDNLTTYFDIIRSFSLFIHNQHLDEKIDSFILSYKSERIKIKIKCNIFLDLFSQSLFQ